MAIQTLPLSHIYQPPLNNGMSIKHYLATHLSKSGKLVYHTLPLAQWTVLSPSSYPSTQVASSQTIFFLYVYCLHPEIFNKMILNKKQVKIKKKEFKQERSSVIGAESIEQVSIYICLCIYIYIEFINKKKLKNI